MIWNNHRYRSTEQKNPQIVGHWPPIYRTIFPQREYSWITTCLNWFILTLALSATIWPQFHFQNMLPPIWPRHRVGVENATHQNIDSTILFDFCAQNMSILHRFAAVHNAADRRMAAYAESTGGLNHNLVSLITNVASFRKFHWLVRFFSRLDLDMTGYAFGNISVP